MKRLYLPVLIFLMMVLAVGKGMAEPMPTVAGVLPAVTTYDELLSAIRETKAESRVRVEALVEEEKVREAWEIGRLIDAHVLQHKEHADYGGQVLIRLGSWVRVRGVTVGAGLEQAMDPR